MPRYDKESLERSTDMTAIQGTVDVDIPIDVLWRSFTRANWWPRWNTCMYAASNRDLIQGQQLIWAFDPIRWYLPYKLPGVAKLVEVEMNSHVTWEVRIMPGFFARHTYSVEDLGNGRTRFGSWEKAMGPVFRLGKRFWLTHFAFVKERSLQGASYLEQIYHHQGRLDHQTLERRSYAPFVGAAQALMRSLGIMRIKTVELVPGVFAALGGGGNSLIVDGGSEALLVDTKLPPWSHQLRRWSRRKVSAPITQVVNTHYHYDHTLGNTLYPGARITAHTSAPDLMRQRDQRWWEKHPAGVPREKDLTENGTTLKIGDQQVSVHRSGQGHTITDLWVHLRRGDVDIIATGDVASLSVYPYFELDSGGTNIPNMVKTLHHWAETYPEAIFVPGHGGIATSADLIKHADYLEFLWQTVGRARSGGLTENQTVATIDLTRYRLTVLPLFHYGTTFLSARSNIRSVYRMLERAESS